MAIKAVIFDIGGVLEHTPPTGWQKRWAEELGMAAREIDTRLEPIWAEGSIGGLTLDQVERRTAEALGLDERRLRRLMSELWREYLGSLNQELTGFFAGLAPRYRTGILSNSFVGARERERAAYGLEDLCDAVIYSHEEGMMKPDPRIYRIACERLDVRPEQALFLDDSPPCVDGARAVGMRAVRFVDNEQTLRELSRLL